jgi:hypothetical protein
MYFEKNRSYVNRHGWTFTHEGRELQVHAEALCASYASKEMAARNTAADLLRQPDVHHQDKRVVAAKDDFVKFGQLKEQCAVWAHEFARTPARAFSLGIDDVLFFGLFHKVVFDLCIVVPTYGYSAAKRGDWKFTYKGSELFGAFRAKCQQLEAERSALDPDDDAEEWEEIQRELVENTLLAKEFEINPDKETVLALGDVVYLNLAPLLQKEEEDAEQE